MFVGSVSLIAIVKTVVDEESLFSTAKMTQSPKPAPNNASSAMKNT